mmetsp:Transcript_14836/g.18208  ORF Transcript_14836/g.18208 Transcript_14836/m.18208 type:complete len:324 (-) Transcript_14836:318-1289(-)
MLCPMVSTGICFGNFYVDLGCSAPQVNGRFIFVIQGKALWGQCAMPPAVLGATHFVSPAIAKFGISPNLDCDKMVNELWCFCKGIDIRVGNPFFGKEAVNISCHNRCEMIDVGDPCCYGICVRLCIQKRTPWWLYYCFYEGIGICAVGNPFFGGEAVILCYHSKLNMMDMGDPFCSSMSVCLCIVKMFSELWWLHYCFCEEIDIGNVGTPCFGGEAVNIWCHSWRGMTMVGDPSCSGICDCLCIDTMFSELWWSNYCFCVGSGIGDVGNPTLGGKTLSICCHSRCVIIDVDDTICRSIRAWLCIMDHCSCHQPQDFPSAFAFT